MSARIMLDGAAPHEIPMIDLRAQHATIEGEILEAFRSVLSSGRFILGEAVESFEMDLAKLCEARHAIACNSGTDALWLAGKRKRRASPFGRHDQGPDSQAKREYKACVCSCSKSNTRSVQRVRPRARTWVRPWSTLWRFSMRASR